MKHLLLLISSILSGGLIFSQTVDTAIYMYYDEQGNLNGLSVKEIYTFNSSCQKTTILTEWWDVASSSWKNNELTTIAYNAKNEAYQMMHKYWHTYNQDWLSGYRDTYSYNSNHQVTQILREYWDTIKGYENAWLTTYTYYNNGLPKSIVEQDWRSNTWNNRGITTWEFNSYGALTQYQNGFWGNEWDIKYRETHSYNTDSTEKQLIVEQWEAESDKLYSSHRTSYSYNMDRTRKEAVSEKLDLQTSVWVKTSRITYSYYPVKTQKDILTQNWDSRTLQWVNVNRHGYTYNSAKMQLSDTTQIWNSNHWVNSKLITNSYNDNNQITSYLNRKWDTASSLWVNYFRKTDTYNEDGSLFESISQVWKPANNAWATTFKNTNYHFSGCALPLTLLNFTAILQGKVAKLEWTTASEINTKNFLIQRSINGINFTNIGSVNANGQSSHKTSYDFEDANAFNTGANKLYYRLQMVDNDGRFTYSKTAVVKIVNDKLFSIYPNPVKDILVITSNTSLGEAEVSITDQSGKLVYNQHIVNMQSGTQSKINVAALNGGLYYLRLVTATGVETTKFVKY